MPNEPQMKTKLLRNVCIQLAFKDILYKSFIQYVRFFKNEWIWNFTFCYTEHSYVLVLHWMTCVLLVLTYEYDMLKYIRLSRVLQNIINDLYITKIQSKNGKYNKFLMCFFLNLFYFIFRIKNCCDHTRRHQKHQRMPPNVTKCR